MEEKQDQDQVQTIDENEIIQFLTKSRHVPMEFFSTYHLPSRTEIDVEMCVWRLGTPGLSRCVRFPLRRQESRKAIALFCSGIAIPSFQTPRRKGSTIRYRTNPALAPVDGCGTTRRCGKRYAFRAFEGGRASAKLQMYLTDISHVESRKEVGAHLP